MIDYIIAHWPAFLVVAMVFSGGTSTSSSRQEEDEADEWAAHSMNEVGMNYKGD